MKISKKARREAKQLFRSCVVNGQLDESRVRTAVQAVAQQQPRGYLAILSHLHRLVKLETHRRTASVDSAAALSPALQASVQSNLTKLYGAGLQFEFTQKAALIGGLRVQVGSDVYDGSIQSRLAALRDSF